MRFVARDQPSMFDDRLPDLTPFASKVSSVGPRAQEIDRAYEKVSQDLLDRYEATMRTYGSVKPDFIAGEVTEYFEARHRHLDKHEKKALGGLYQRLMNRGVIEKTGSYRARNQGNPSAVYRLKK